MEKVTITIGEKDVYPDIIEHDGFKTSVWNTPKGKKVFFKSIHPEDTPYRVVSINEKDTFETFQKGYLGWIKPNQDSQILFLVKGDNS